MRGYMNCSVDIKKILDEINIINADYIRGNIYLPASMGGASITWTSSNCNVISDKKIGKLAPGVVTRLKEETRVILTATVTLGDEVASKDIEVCVLKKPEDINEDDYQGYLFGHFIGEEN